MTKAITYNLKLNEENSNHYYNEIATYADFVHEFIERNYAWIISQYHSFVINKIYEKERSRGEYCIELLIIGMCWNKYSGASRNTSQIVLSTLNLLNNKKNTRLPFSEKIEKLKSFILGSFVVPKINEADKSYEYNLNNFNKLIYWLESTGEFVEEVNKLKNWSAFFSSLNEWKVDFIISSSVALYDWFTISSHITLGKYTEDLQEFLKQHPHKYKHRNDIIFTGKDETEYYLNMICAEIINKALEPVFEKSIKRTIVIPDCMKTNSNQCTLNNFDDVSCCTECTLDCSIAKLFKIGSDYDFNVEIIRHSQNFSQLYSKLNSCHDIGYIVAACLLNMAPTAFALRNTDISAQYISLDYCGCKFHWDEKGVSTDLNREHLFKFLNN